MQHTVDFKECLKDSPKFRASLEDAENDIEALEGRLERLVKQCNVMIDAGKAFSTASSGFVLGVRDLANYFGKDPLVSASLNRFAHSMSEMLKYLNILMDQAHRSVSKNLSSFIRVDIRKVKDTKKLFEKISDDMDSSLVRNSQAQRSKVQECEDANNALTAMRSCFAHTSLDYVFHINVLNSKKRFDILDTMLSFMHAQNTFFHQGHDLFQDLESTYMKDIAGQVEELSGKAKVEMKEMEERHTLVQQKDLSISSILQGNGDILNTEGYLFKRNSNAFKNYARRWFSITDSQLVYRKRSKDNLTVMEEDLRLCTIRPQPELDRRFCFEVLSPSRSHILQADSEEECQMWVQALNASISHAYKTASSGMDQMDRDHGKGTSTSAVSSINSTQNNKDGQSQESKQSKAKIRMEQLLAIPGNSRCCDCGAAEPRWASINLGCTLCIECSGIHRSFGVHMSKVRSITLDTWEPEQLKVMLELGNAVVNGIYEGAVDESIAVRAKPDSSRVVRESWIKAKYVDKAFVKKLPGVTRANKLSKWSVRKKTRRSPARLQALQKSRSSSGSALSKTVSLPGNLSSSGPGAEGTESEKNSPQSKDSGREDSMLSGSGSAEEDEAFLTSDMLEGGAAGSKRSVESCPPSRAVMSVSGGSITKSLSGGENDGGTKVSTTGSDIGDSGIADTTSSVEVKNGSTATAGANDKGIVFGVERPPLLYGLNKSLDLESSDDSCHDFDDAEDQPTTDTSAGAVSSSSALTDRSSGMDCATEDDLTTSWEDMSRLDPHLLLYKACGARNLPVMLQALANKADPNWVNLEDGGRTPIMRGIMTGSMATCEFLLLNNAKLDRKDRHGQTPLHHATILSHTGQVCQLLKRRADLNAKDNQQRTPLMIAVDNANADIVTLLRLAKFDEEMKESDGYLANPADDTFQDVFRDFTNMASNNPEKLKRK